jgi:xanthine dehydrogenase accessory factor
VIALLDDLDRWFADGRRVVTATVVDVQGSGPRDPGAQMAVNDCGEIAGSVSGGCVDGAVAQGAAEILAGAGPQLLAFGVEDVPELTIGLACGGTVQIFLQELDW